MGVYSGRLKKGVLGAGTARKRGVLCAGPTRKKGVLGAGQVKKGVFTAAHTYTEHICEYPPPPPGGVRTCVHPSDNGNTDLSLIYLNLLSWIVYADQCIISSTMLSLHLTVYLSPNMIMQTIFLIKISIW